VAPAPLRRLTRQQYANTVRDLLGVRFAIDMLSPDEQVGPFQTNLVGTVSDLVGQQYMEAAESLAKAAGPRLEGLVPCNRATLGDAACADQFIERFGLRAYRRPLTPEERARYKAAFTTHAAQGGYTNGARVVVRVMLQAPAYLYHVEGAAALAGAPAVVPLEPFVLASRLSYFVWASMPDDALFAAAAAGQLADQKSVRAQVERMLKDAKARDSLASFHAQWLGLSPMATLSKDPKVYPAFTPQLRAAMDAETAAFAEQVLRRGDGRLTTLFTAPLGATADAGLLKHYGAGAPRGGRASAAARSRAWRAAHPGGVPVSSRRHEPVAASASGRRDHQEPALHGAAGSAENVNNAAPNPSKDATTRERFAEHERNPACAGCHKLVDGVGLGFEAYDGVGPSARPRTASPSTPAAISTSGGPSSRARSRARSRLARSWRAAPSCSSAARGSGCAMPSGAPRRRPMPARCRRRTGPCVVRRVFGRLFTNKGGDQPRAERRTAIDILKPELEGLRAKIGPDDRPKLEAHLEAVRAIERRLRTTGSLCKGSAAPMALQGAMVNPNDVANTAWTFDRQIELISLACACDVTRFASLQYTIGDTDGRPCPWLGIAEGHHVP
jgi:hypothetical protein